MKHYTSPVLVATVATDIAEIRIGQVVVMTGCDGGYKVSHARIKATPENIEACTKQDAFLGFCYVGKDCYTDGEDLELPAGKVVVAGDYGKERVDLKNKSLLRFCSIVPDGFTPTLIELVPPEEWEADPQNNMPALFLPTPDGLIIPQDAEFKARYNIPDYIFGLDDKFWDMDGNPIEKPDQLFQQSGTEPVATYFKALIASSEYYPEDHLKDLATRLQQGQDKIVQELALQPDAMDI